MKVSRLQYTVRLKIPISDLLGPKVFSATQEYKSE